MEHLIKGLIIGFGISAPVGPINLLCLRRSLSEGRRMGFVSGLGAAAADTTYGAIAAVGMTAITSFLLAHNRWLQAIGGAFLLILGIGTIRSPLTKRAVKAELHVGRLWDAFVSTYMLTLANPMTIIAFASVFAGVGLGGQNAGSFSYFELVGGVFLGSSCWWLTLSLLAGTFGHRLDDGTLCWINRIAGAVLAAFGLWELGLAVASWIR